MPHRLAAIVVLSVILAACIPPSDEVIEQPVVLDLNNPGIQRIYELQNTRAEDSLRAYLTAPDASYRYLAARALGSFPRLSKATVDSLAACLTDDIAVRIQAAYALGQTGSPEAAGHLTRAFDRSGRYPAFNAAVLAAAGRSADAATAELLAGISTYTEADTTLMEGRLWGLYYAALRGHHGTTADRVVLETVASPTAAAELRKPAAYYLHRIEVPVDTAEENRLLAVLRRESDPDVAMGIIRCLGRSGRNSARVALLRRFEQTREWRERVEVLRAFRGFDYAAVRESVIEALRNPHPLVALTAAEYLLEQGTEADATFYQQLADDNLPAPVRIQLLRAANRHLAVFLTDYRDRVNNDLRRMHREAVNPYERADALRALGEFPWMYRILFNYYREAETAVERSAAAESLAGISQREDFDTYFRGSARRVRVELAGFFRTMIESGDDGPAVYAAQALAADPDTYRAQYPDATWLTASLDAFALPRQVETYREVFAARNALRGTDTELPDYRPAAVAAIDWPTVLQEEIVVNLATPGGNVRLRLWPHLAPATVSSFVRLVRDSYYDGKAFHRVVPNFVAQGGGPRGDGYGAEDFVVRTETPGLRWDRPGLVGMASAGKDTEGVQFFITHRPTPHLDGGYTIFGEVVEGQDVVDRLIPGSPINRVSLR